MESSPNGTRPHRPLLAAPAPRSHWERWQAYAIAHHGLLPGSAAAGFTLLKCTPSMRPAFFDLLRLIIARARMEGQLGCLTADPVATTALQEALTAWTAWQRSTVQLARAFERLAQGRGATLPPVPVEFHALAAALDALAVDTDKEATL